MEARSWTLATGSAASRRAWLQLVRPANLVTAAADACAGFALALPAAPPAALPWLVGASVCLYAGGVVLNDVADAALDARERPERPIPSGCVARAPAALVGGSLLALGVGCAALAGGGAGVVALVLAACVLTYDFLAKGRPLAGPLVMGACRGLDLAMGLAVVPALLAGRWWLALAPLAYVAAITAVSRGEVAGAGRAAPALALVLLATVLAALPAGDLALGGSALAALPFLAWFAWGVAPAFWAAWRTPAPATARAAVRAGVLSIVALDAAIAAGFAGPLYGLAVLALGLLAAPLARAFAVT
jgi:4-hydroxybenzoate polyprenyltransferase